VRQEPRWSEACAEVLSCGASAAVLHGRHTCAFTGVPGRIIDLGTLAAMASGTVLGMRQVSCTRAGALALVADLGTLPAVVSVKL